MDDREEYDRVMNQIRERISQESGNAGIKRFLEVLIDRLSTRDKQVTKTVNELIEHVRQLTDKVEKLEGRLEQLEQHPSIMRFS